MGTSVNHCMVGIRSGHIGPIDQKVNLFNLYPRRFLKYKDGLIYQTYQLI